MSGSSNSTEAEIIDFNEAKVNTRKWSDLEKQKEKEEAARKRKEHNDKVIEKYVKKGT